MAMSDPLPAYLNGWHLAWFSADLRPGKIRSGTIFGRQIVAFRDPGGRARVLDAHCPHLGAHLGKGGTLVNGVLRCPFHGWRFDGEGRCVGVPFTDKVPQKTRIASWPVHEVNGGIYVWHHDRDVPPSYRLPAHPAFERATGSVPVRGVMRVRSKLQELAENTVDLLHFPAVHRGSPVTGVRELPRMARFENRGHELHLHLQTVSHLFGRPQRTKIFFRLVGPSVNLTTVEAAVKVHILTTTTPVDEEQVRFYYMVRAETKLPLLRRAIEAITAAALRREVREDTVIWENKIYRAKPRLSEADGPIMRFRAWMSQFYPEPDARKTPAGLKTAVRHRSAARRPISALEA